MPANPSAWPVASSQSLFAPASCWMHPQSIAHLPLIGISRWTWNIEKCAREPAQKRIKQSVFFLSSLDCSHRRHCRRRWSFVRPGSFVLCDLRIRKCGVFYECVELVVNFFLYFLPQLESNHHRRHCRRRRWIRSLIENVDNTIRRISMVSFSLCALRCDASLSRTMWMLKIWGNVRLHRHRRSTKKRSSDGCLCESKNEGKVHLNNSRSFTKPFRFRFKWLGPLKKLLVLRDRSPSRIQWTSSFCVKR